MKTGIKCIILFLAVVLSMELFVEAGLGTFIVGCVFIFIVSTLLAIVGMITHKGGD